MTRLLWVAGGVLGRASPAPTKTLAALAADPLIDQAVLSGNLRGVSRIKFEVFGLDPYPDLAVPTVTTTPSAPN